MSSHLSLVIDHWSLVICTLPTPSLTVTIEKVT